MRQINITDEWLYKYMPILDEAIINEIEKQVDKNYIFSEAFHKKMDKIIRWERKNALLNAFIKAGKKAAIFVLLVVSSLFTIMMSVKAYRVRFFEAVKNIWEDSFSYTYFTEENEAGFPKYRFKYLPEGYELMEEVSNDNTRTVTYSNERGEQILVDQYLASNKRTITLDMEYDKERTVDINGISLKIYRYSHGFVCAYYEYKNSVFVLYIDNLPDHEIIKIMENMN